MRKVGAESRRTWQQKHASGFFDRYMTGNGLDIGFSGYEDAVLPILETATGIDKDYLGYDGFNLPFQNESQDYVYSSHCLEHIQAEGLTIQEWFRVLKLNGHLVIVVPHMYLYEKKQHLPSKWNEDHKRFYTPGSLLIAVENSLPPNSYRVRFLEDGDDAFDYHKGPDTHSDGQYEVTLVIQKIKPPIWNLE